MALVLLAGSLLFSAAFNVAWAWGGPVLSVIAAGCCTLIVPAGLHLWPLIPARNLAVKVVRAVVMTGVCAAAAITSFTHIVDVLLAAGWTELAAWSVTGGVECLVALSTMAVRSPKTPPASAPEQLALLIAVARMAASAQRPAPQIRRRRSESPTSAAADPKKITPPAKPDDEDLPTVGLRAAARKWALDNYPCSGGAIVRAVGCSRAEGDRARAWAKEQKEVAS